MATLKLADTAGIMKIGNKEAAILAAQLTGGNMLNDRLMKLVIPQLPLKAQLLANNAMGKAIISNAFAAGIFHFLPGNGKATAAADMMIQSAMVDLVGSFNIEEMVDEFLDGITLPTVEKNTTEDKLDLGEVLKQKN